MRSEMVTRLTSILSGMLSAEAPVTRVTPVTPTKCYRHNLLMLHELQALQVENCRTGNGPTRIATKALGPPTADIEVAIEERAALAADVVPAVYLHAWAHLNCHKPGGIEDKAWWQALDDGGRFLDRWGGTAEKCGWLPADLFNVPDAGKLGGLIWFAGGRMVIAIEPRCARFSDGEVFFRHPGICSEASAATGPAVRFFRKGGAAVGSMTPMAVYIKSQNDPHL